MSIRQPQHPIFPYGMELDVRLAIGDELDVTLAGFPMYRAAASREHALTVYAEQLGGFTASDVREGFRLARARSVTYAPTATVVRQCVGEACASRLARERAAEQHAAKAEQHEPLDAAAIPDWRGMLESLGMSIGNPPAAYVEEFEPGRKHG